MNQVTRWFPDTCDCVFEYEWDDSDDPKTRKHTLKNVVKPCEAHKDGDFEAATEENTRKNRAFAILQELKPDFDPDDFKFSYDENRKLKIDLSGKLDVSDRAKFNREVEKKLGKDKIEVI